MAFLIRKFLETRGHSKYSYLAKDAKATDDDALNQHLISDEESLDHVISKPKPNQTGVLVFKRIAIILWTLLSTGAFLTGLYWRLHMPNMCKDLDSFWTPVWNDVDPKFNLVRFNGTLDAWSEWRGPPSADVDEAWSRLDDFGSVALSEEEFLRAGGTLDHARMPDEFGGGYMADIEVLHQMHCLNFVRMAVYSDHYSSIAPEWKDSKRTLDFHLEHCIEMLRVNLLCRTDAGVIPFRWVEGYQRPLPDFSTMHQCRDWEGVMDWTRQREVAVPKGYQWKSQPGETRFPKPKWMLHQGQS